MNEIDYTTDMISDSPIYEEPAKIDIQKSITPVIPFTQIQDIVNNDTKNIHLGISDYINIGLEKIKNGIKIVECLPSTINFINQLKEEKMATTGTGIAATANQFLTYLEMLAPVFKKALPDDLKADIANAVTLTGQAADADIKATEGIMAWIKSF